MVWGSGRLGTRFSTVHYRGSYLCLARSEGMDPYSRPKIHPSKKIRVLLPFSIPTFLASQRLSTSLSTVAEMVTAKVAGFVTRICSICIYCLYTGILL